jgi:cytochrome c551
MTRILAPLVPIALATLVACSGDSKDTADTSTAGTTGGHPALSLTGDAMNGATVFDATCAVCHGADGMGVSGPDITGEVAELSDETLVDIMANGSGSMPAQDLSDQELADVLAHLRATWG